MFQPFSDDDPGVYMIDLKLTDGYSQPLFFTIMITIEKRPPRHQTKLKPV
jgi:hypothetical protein